VQPFRLSHEQAQTCDQDHGYTDAQKAFDGGLMDKFVETVGRGAGSCADYGHGKGRPRGSVRLGLRQFRGVGGVASGTGQGVEVGIRIHSNSPRRVLPISSR
jgi:hypothetical protein